MIFYVFHRFVGFCFFCFFFFATWHMESYLTSPTKDQTRPPVLEVQSLNHWTTKEVPTHFMFKSISCGEVSPNAAINP